MLQNIQQHSGEYIENQLINIDSHKNYRAQNVDFVTAEKHFLGISFEISIVKIITFGSC